MLTQRSFVVAMQRKRPSIPHHHVLTLLPPASLLLVIKLIALLVLKCIPANSYSRIYLSPSRSV